MTIRCDACGVDNPTTSRFCGACGSPLGIRCSTCGSPVQRGYRFCGTCGSEVDSGSTGAGQAATSQSAGAATAAPDLAPADPGTVRISPPLAERRHVSILFADLVGFTSLAEGRDPEEVRDLQTRYFETCRTVIARYGGTIEKFIGDAVMAMWGAPLAHEDDAERAVRAALGLVAAVGSLGEELGLEGLSARSGIVSGEAAVTVGAVGQGMVAGDVVNTAARLQAAARPGTVLVDQATYQTVRGSLSFERAGDQHLPGKRIAVPAWEARQVVALRGGEGRAALPEAPLVGRDSAMALVRDLFHAAREDRSVRLLSIFGQAGVGKSRLVWELEKYIDGIVGPIHWHRARSAAYGEGQAFGPLAEMVRWRAHIGEGNTPQSARRRLSACLARYVPDNEERRWVGAHVAALIGLAPAPASERDEAFAAWRTFFERVADESTTILVFEDLHWAEPSLLDFVDHLATRSTDRPMLIVTVARPSLLERRPDWGAGRRDYVAIHLEPLGRAPMTELLTALAPGLPGPIASTILDRAEGIPLYAVEILRMLVDRGDLAAVDGTYEVRGELGELTIPESLHALVAARLDGLEPDDRAVLRDAAVLGRGFRPEALAAVAGVSVGEIQPIIERLVRRQLLAPDIDDRGPGPGRFNFAEWLVREIAYGTLSLRDRRVRHLAAGDYFEALDDPDFVGAAGLHLLAAVRAGPTGPETSALSSRAARALRSAARRALELHAPEQALEFLDGALSVVEADDERVALWEEAAAAAQATARLTEAEANIRKAIEWHRAHGDRSALARTTTRLGSILIHTYEPEESAAVVLATLDELADDPSLQGDPALVSLMGGLARAYMVHGRMHEAVEWADRALAGAEAMGLRPVIADALATKGVALNEQARTTEGIGLLRAALTMADEHGLIVAALRARNGLAIALLADDPKAALDTARAGMDLARRVGLRDLEIRLASNWAEAALDMGRWDELIHVLSDLLSGDLHADDRVDFAGSLAVVAAWRGEPDALDRFVELGTLIQPDDVLGEAALLWRQSMAELAIGRREAASDHALVADRAFHSFGALTEVLDGLLPMGRALLWSGDLERAEQVVADVAGRFNGRRIGAMLETLKAGLAGRRGQDQAAERYLDAAEQWRRLDVPVQLALCQLEAATFLSARDEVATAAAEARTIFRDLGAVALLDRLEEAVSGHSPDFHGSMAPIGEASG